MTRFHNFLWILECALWNSFKYSSSLWEQSNRKSESILQQYFVPSDGREGVELFYSFCMWLSPEPLGAPGTGRRMSLSVHQYPVLEPCIVLMLGADANSCTPVPNLSSSKSVWLSSTPPYKVFMKATTKGFIREN